MEAVVALIFLLLVSLVLLVVIVHQLLLKIASVVQISLPVIGQGFWLVLPICVGTWGLWEFLSSPYVIRFTEVSLPLYFRISGLCLYLAGCLCYIELRSLLFRGYSLRILVDLLEGGGRGDMGQLKANYGMGMGIKGIVIKRLKSLEQLKLIRLTDRDAGPLTLVGIVLSITGSCFRRILRLDNVG